ncbi:energy-coupling factor transporter ATPase, partial [Staphylococcus devriesei]
NYAEEIIVMKEGSVLEQVSPKQLFKQASRLEEWHITLPDIVHIM